MCARQFIRPAVPRLPVRPSVSLLVIAVHEHVCTSRWRHRAAYRSEYERGLFILLPERGFSWVADVQSLAKCESAQVFPLVQVLLQGEGGLTSPLVSDKKPGPCTDPFGLLFGYFSVTCGLLVGYC